jgi:hypothetical protein
MPPRTDGAVPTGPSIAARVSERGAVIEVRGGLYLRLDAAGRWTAFGEGGVLFRRTVEGGVVRPRGTGIETLTDAEAASVESWVVRRAGEVLELLAETPASDVALIGAYDHLRAGLERAACARARRADEADRREAFAAAYPEPVPILPPHRYRDLVVLPATGCPNHRCAFCAFYRDRPFRLLDDAAFRAHLQAVRVLFGAALADRDGIFLGSASALSIPDRLLARRLGEVIRAFGVPRRGIAAFHDPDRTPARDVRDWAALVDAGLTEATLGLETGEPTLRRAVGKSGDLDRFACAVADQKAGGLRVSLTVLVDLGGAEAAETHREATVHFLARLPLTPADRVYLSPLVSVPGPAAGAGPSAGPHPVLPAGPHPALPAWRAALAAATAARVGEYRIERFAFLA